MYHGAAIDENAIVTLTTNESGTQILDWFREYRLLLPLSRIGIIDCTTKSPGRDAVENENIKMASSPVDLTGMGVRISEFFEDFRMFIYVYTGRIRAAGALGVFVMESDMHDEQAIAALKQLFDGVIEIKSEDDVDYVRIAGLSSKPTPWFEYEIEGAKLRIRRTK